jgi:RNase H-fold protein (predicted Holliday junction resolvase)
MYLVIDPGRDKCGLALFSKLDAKSGLILREVVQTTLVEDYLKDLFIKNSVKHLILGDRTNHSKIRKLVEKLNKNIKTILIDLFPRIFLQ